MIICICHRVSDRDIVRAAREGCSSFEELQFDLRVATCCGKCEDSARETWEHHVTQLAGLHGQPLRGETPEPRRVIPIASQRPADAPASVAA
jgi:bacterioferritin-associated ferredoxin